MYTVIKKFTDLETNHIYHVGDNYPVRGQSTQERILELSTPNNKLGEPLITEIKSDPKQHEGTAKELFERLGIADEDELIKRLSVKQAETSEVQEEETSEVQEEEQEVTKPKPSTKLGVKK